MKLKIKWAKYKRKFNRIIPAIITGGSGNDPAGIITYTAVGAQTGTSLAWLLFLSTPMMIEVQHMAAKLAVITKKNLPQIIKEVYSQKLAILIVASLAVLNTITIAADLQGLSQIVAFLTSTKAVYWDAPITALIAYLVIFKSYDTVKSVLTFFSFTLCVYIINALFIHPPLKKIALDLFIPHIKPNLSFILAALGLLGTTISPYLLFWQASQEKEENKSIYQVKSIKFATVIGMVFSNLVALGIIISAAAIFYKKGVSLNTVKDAALALKPLVGKYAFLLFSIGIIASGLLAIPVLAGSTAYAVASVFGWKEGLKNKPSEAKGFYAVFFGALVIGNFLQMFKVSAVDALYYSQVLDGLLLPLMIGILLLLSNNKNLLKEHTNNLWENFFGFITFIITLAFSLYTIKSIIFN